ncbi:hypothetical protein FB451DRAFT_1413759 [Mycena latifolia]|nr:hypothetical protein FB451DRAFT_1413759 [Mycena latifolia]
MLRLLSACCPCLRHTDADPEDDYTVIPNETARFTSCARCRFAAVLRRGAPVDTQKLSERSSTWAWPCAPRRGDGQRSMRTPFVMHRTPSAPPSHSPSFASTLYAKSHNRYFSPDASRSSSRRRADTICAHGVGMKQSSQWLGESASESGVEVEDSGASAAGAGTQVLEERRVCPMPDGEVRPPAAPVPITAVRAGGEGARGKAEARGLGIAFSWSDT